MATAAIRQPVDRVDRLPMRVPTAHALQQTAYAISANAVHRVDRLAVDQRLDQTVDVGFEARKS
ncbi:MAG: hypothetical protein KDI64_16615, partial [Candidatus Accumulibacter sp.]|nr:hypothetical protein [Accumulibacter sp.]